VRLGILSRFGSHLWKNSSDVNENIGLGRGLHSLSAFIRIMNSKITELNEDVNEDKAKANFNKANLSQKKLQEAVT